MPDSFDQWLSGLGPASRYTPAGPEQLGGLYGVPSASIFQGPGGQAAPIPAMWLAFAPRAAGLINEAAGAQASAVTSGTTKSRYEFERDLLNLYQAQGVDPLYARSQLAESRPQVGYDIQQQLGGIESNRLLELLNLQTGVQNALSQSFLGDRDLALQLYLAAKGRSAARSGAQSAQHATLGGAALGALGSALGGYLGRGGDGEG